MRVCSKMQLSLCLSSCKQVHRTKSAKENRERSIIFTVQARVGIVYESKSSNAVRNRVDILRGGKWRRKSEQRSSTVAGIEWIKSFILNLREEDKKRVKVEKSTRVYKFGGGETRNSICVVQLPCHLARTNVLVDMVETKSGHFSIPISRPKQGDRYAEEIQICVRQNGYHTKK